MKFVKIFTFLTVFFGGFAFAQVNINTATLAELTALHGIGEVKAKAIIKYRKANGKFKSVSDLTNVAGIGEGTVTKLGRDIKTTGTTDVSKLTSKGKAVSSKKKTTSKKSTVKKSAEKKTTKTTKAKTEKAKTTKSKSDKTKSSKTKSSKAKSSKKTTSKSKKAADKKKSTKSKTDGKKKIKLKKKDDA